MKTIDFVFNSLDDIYFVKFDSESIERNRLMEVQFSGFKLDVAELRMSHPLLYADIKKEMIRLANEYWNTTANEQISEIPTLAYQDQKKKPEAFKGIFHEFSKAFLTLLFICFSFLCFSQGFAAGEVTNHGLGINAGYIYNNIQIKAGLNSPVNRRAATPNIFYAAAGYQVNVSENISFTPSIGISKYHVIEFSGNSHSSNDPVEINQSALFTSLELGRNFIMRNGNEGRYYLFINHAVKTFVGAGLKIFIQ